MHCAVQFNFRKIMFYAYHTQQKPLLLHQHFIRFVLQLSSLLGSKKDFCALVFFIMNAFSFINCSIYAPHYPQVTHLPYEEQRMMVGHRCPIMLMRISIFNSSRVNNYCSLIVIWYMCFLYESGALQECRQWRYFVVILCDWAICLFLLSCLFA